MLDASSVTTIAKGKPLTFAASKLASAAASHGKLGAFSTLANVQNTCLHVTGDITPGGLAIGTSSGGVKGIYIPAVDDAVTTGILSGGATFAYSDRFAGCDFTILKNPQNAYVACHVYSSDACRASVVPENLPAGWSLVYTWRSKPYSKPEKWGLSAAIHSLAIIDGAMLSLIALKIGVKFIPGAEMEAVVQDASLSAQVSL